MIKAIATHGSHKANKMQAYLKSQSRVDPMVEQFVDSTKCDFDHILELTE